MNRFITISLLSGVLLSGTSYANQQSQQWEAQRRHHEQYQQNVAAFLEKESKSPVIVEFGLTPDVESPTFNQANLALELNRSKGFSLREMRLEMKIIGACTESYADHQIAPIYKIIANNHSDRVKAIETFCAVSKTNFVEPIPNYGVKLAKALIDESEKSYKEKVRVCGRKFKGIRAFEKKIEDSIDNKLGSIEKKIKTFIPIGSSFSDDKKKVIEGILSTIGLEPQHLSGDNSSYEIKYHVTRNGLGLDLSFAMTDSSLFMSAVSLFIDKVTYTFTDADKNELVEIIGENKIGNQVEILSRGGNGEIHNTLGMGRSDVYVRLGKIAYGDACHEVMNIQE